MTELEILITTGAMSIAAGVIWWTLEDFPTKPKKKRRILKPHLCRECGTRDPEDFYPTEKSLCKKCKNKALKMNRRALKQKCSNGSN